jgi:urease accessory protein
VRRRAAPALALGPLLAAGPAVAHDAFGDLGPFYASLLHPLADPAQGLLIAAVAVLLACQPPATVRPAYATLALAGAAAMLLAAFVTVDPPGLRATGLIAAVLGAAALFGASLRPLPATLVAAGIAVAAGLAVDLPHEPRAAALAAFGAALGIALAALLVWGLIDEARRRLGPVAPAVAGSWIAAVGIMAAALPAG